MIKLNRNDVKVWTDLQEQILGAGMMTDVIEWEFGTAERSGTINCHLTPKEHNLRGFLFVGSKQDFDSLLAFVKYLRRTSGTTVAEVGGNVADEQGTVGGKGE